MMESGYVGMTGGYRGYGEPQTLQYLLSSYDVACLLSVQCLIPSPITVASPSVSLQHFLFLFISLSLSLSLHSTLSLSLSPPPPHPADHRRSRRGDGRSHQPMVYTPWPYTRTSCCTWCMCHIGDQSWPSAPASQTPPRGHTRSSGCTPCPDPRRTLRSDTRAPHTHCTAYTLGLPTPFPLASQTPPMHTESKPCTPCHPPRRNLPT